MMRFESWGEFVVMDGHGSYVLAAYAIGLVCFLGLLLESRLRLRALKRASQQKKINERANEQTNEPTNERLSGMNGRRNLPARRA